ncbi:DNA-3-methyladenine glycosylase I [Mesoplasma melaleucae]|uniref:DNA-3-methyladenine glycosylase n=1 Tax=Mesoplasma melaleucae TaxID=81459 RepID=A0A2K8NZ87_9MOLU|nr:DNA-3-methyladenine glycosylase I [Mesoplasma melaleucae]ATZ17953.1 DNA-3-methyladenine glycosylase [Mesoplasma melaleucae]
MENIKRCDWSVIKEEKNYHNNEWGFENHSDEYMFELLILENMQAGLSWRTILVKGEGYQKAFDNFNYNKLINYDENKVNELMQNPNIIRNKLKIKAAISNAKYFIEIQKEFSSFDNYIWGFVDHKQIVNLWKTIKDLPAETDLSITISKDLKSVVLNLLGLLLCIHFYKQFELLMTILMIVLQNHTNHNISVL